MNDVAYGAGARLFHWVTVALLLIIIPVGLVMGGLPRGRLQDTLFVTHETLGVTVLGVTLLRLWWRLAHPPPSPSAALGPVERRARKFIPAPPRPSPPAPWCRAERTPSSWSSTRMSPQTGWRFAGR